MFGAIESIKNRPRTMFRTFDHFTTKSPDNRTYGHSFIGFSNGKKSKKRMAASSIVDTSARVILRVKREKNYGHIDK